MEEKEDTEQETYPMESQAAEEATPQKATTARKGFAEYTPSHSQFGTPGSTFSHGSHLSEFGSHLNTPSRSLPRGDIGGSSRIPMGTPTLTPSQSSDQGAVHRTPRAPTFRGGRDHAEQDTFEQMDETEFQNLDINDGHDLTRVMIWGTTVEINTCMNMFRQFLESFQVSDVDFLSYYHRELAIMYRTGHYVLNLNCSHLKMWPATRDFYKKLVTYPHEIIPIMDQVVKEAYLERHGATDGDRAIQVRTFNLEKQSRMRDLDPGDIDQLLSIKGMVIRCSSIIPDLKQAFFRCFVCHDTVNVMIDKGRIDEPARCVKCNKLASMELIHNRCYFSDKQMIRLQETPDEIPEGETPYTITIFAFEGLVDTVRPGDRIEVTGIFRAIPRRPNPKMRTVKSIYKTYLDAIHFRRAETGENRMVIGDDPALLATSNSSALDTSAMTNDTSFTHTPQSALPQGSGSGGHNAMSAAKQFSKERIRDFKAFVQAGNVYDRLVRSFAPSVWEMDDVKRGLLCLLFGGTIRRKGKRKHGANGGSNKYPRTSAGTALESENLNGDEDENDNGEDEDDADEAALDASVGVHQRGDINILLCGDPGTSKSQLLSYVHKITPRGIYTSGKGSSAVGLTASVVRDPESRDMVLESGALVLSDNGICCIDEFDKMSDQTRAILHEAMEQQTVSITKAGIIATLNARTSILASANPVESRYNARLSVVENIKLPPTLLSRFDLIYLVLDKPNKDSDRRLARHLVSLYYPEEAHVQPPTETELHDNIRNGAQLVDQQFLKDFISYARNNICPEISNDAEEELVKSYLEMRSLGGRGLKTITATPRQLESLIRISQALAKMRLSEVVLGSDVLEATRLMKVATQAAATDPRTGTIDMDMITTGRATVDQDLVSKLADELRSFFEKQKGTSGRYTIGQIRQQILRNMSTAAGHDESYRPNDDGRGSVITVSMAEVENAVRKLHDEGVLTFNDVTQSVIIR